MKPGNFEKRVTIFMTDGRRIEFPVDSKTTLDECARMTHGPSWTIPGLDLIVNTQQITSIGLDWVRR